MLKRAQSLGLLLQRVQIISFGDFHVVLSLHVHRVQELRLGNLHLDFRRCYGKARMPQQKSTAKVEPSWRTSTRAVQRGNVGLESPNRVPTGVLPSGAVRRGPMSSRPQNDGSTNSLHCVPGKVTDTQPACESRQEWDCTLQSYRSRAAQDHGNPPLVLA